MRVLITGGASGLGKALAQRYTEAGARVLVSDVDSVAGEATAAELGSTAAFLKLDVTSDADWVAAREWCEREWDGLDVLINNAGVAGGGRFERISIDDWDWILRINVMGVVRGCHEFVPLFKAQRSGHLVNVASLAAIMNLPGMSSYNVAKTAVLSLSETLRTELEPYGIGTTVVCPGFFQTNLGATLRSPDPAVTKVMSKIMESAVVTAKDVAAQVFDAVESGQFMVLTHDEGRLAYAMKRTDPDAVDEQRADYWRRLRAKIEGEDS